MLTQPSPHPLFLHRGGTTHNAGDSSPFSKVAAENLFLFSRNKKLIYKLISDGVGNLFILRHVINTLAVQFDF